MRKMKIEIEVHESFETVYRSKVSEWVSVSVKGREGKGRGDWLERSWKRTLLTRCLHKYPLICFDDHLPKHFVRNKFKLKAKKRKRMNEEKPGFMEKPFHKVRPTSRMQFIQKCGNFSNSADCCLLLLPPPLCVCVFHHTFRFGLSKSSYH